MSSRKNAKQAVSGEDGLVLQMEEASRKQGTQKDREGLRDHRLVNQSIIRKTQIKTARLVFKMHTDKHWFLQEEPRA